MSIPYMVPSRLKIGQYIIQAYVYLTFVVQAEVALSNAEGPWIRFGIFKI